MATTQSKLKELEPNLDESIGVRKRPGTRSQLSPVASPKDIGRRPLRNYGRIAIDQVIPDPNQPRSEFSDESIDQMAKSFASKGQLAPIRVRWGADKSKWIIVYGERRWRAAHAANAKTIDCYFDDQQPSEAQILEQQMIENLLRENLSPIDQARGFSALMELHNWNGKQVAESLNVPASTVSRALALLDLPQDVQDCVDDGQLAPRSAYELSKLPDASVQRELAQKAVEGKLTHDQAAQAVKKRSRKAEAKKRGFKQSFFADGGIKITASAHKKVTYEEVEVALKQALDEVRHYIDQGRNTL